MMRLPTVVTGLVFAVAAANVTAQEAGAPFTFVSHGSTLQARWFAAPTQPAPTVVLLHGFPGGRGDVLGFGRALSESGWNAMSFTFRGIYESEGTYTLSNTVEDVIAATEYLESRTEGAGPVAVLGWSGGGWSGLMAAARSDKIDCAVSVAGANMSVWARQIMASPEGRRFWQDMLEQLTTGSPARGLGGEGSVRELLENSTEYDLLTHADALMGKELLIVGGWRDEQVTLEETVLPLVRGLRAAGVERLTAETIDDDHMFRNSRPELHQLVSEWLNGTCRRSPQGM